MTEWRWVDTPILMTSLISNGPELWIRQFPWPETQTHKYHRGHLAVFGGGLQSTGAARLSALSGLRIGAGLVTLLSPPEALLVNACHLTAVMIKRAPDLSDLTEALADYKAVVIGPGLGLTEENQEIVQAVLNNKAGAVLDADALTLFQKDPPAFFRLLRPGDILTPHEGEFVRLFPGSLAEFGRIGAAQRAANKTGATIVLKGPQTLIAAPDGRMCQQFEAPAWLATAGSGDVLAGLIGGLVTQGMSPFLAACAGVWIHAEAARKFGPGLIAEDLPDQIPAVLSDLAAYQAA